MTVEGSVPGALSPSAQEQHARRALGDAQRHLQRSALKLVGYLVVAYLVLKLIPALEEALRSLEHVSWEWLLGAIALAGMLVVYGVDRDAAIAAVLLHQAVGLLVPLIGGAIGYAIVRRRVGPITAARDETVGEAPSAN